MWLELVSIFRKGDPMETLASEFRDMLRLLQQMCDIVKDHIFDQNLSLDQRSQVYKLDVKVNKLERSIRKRVVSHVTLSRDHVPYCLLLMTLVKDAERHGVRVRPIDVTRSDWRCTLEPGDSMPDVRIGLRFARHFRAASAEQLMGERARRSFTSPADFAARVALARNELESLAELGALASLEGPADPSAVCPTFPTESR